MPMINCPECGNEISSTASSCPKCGFKINKNRNTRILIIFCIVLLLITFALIIFFTNRNKKPESISNIVYANGISVVETVDSVLDGKMSVDDAYKKVQFYYELADNDNSDGYYSNLSVTSEMIQISLDLIKSSNNLITPDLKSDRDELAKLLNYHK